MSVTEDLYAYFKDKYGIKETEVFNPAIAVEKIIEVCIPGIRKCSPEHKWVVLIENDGHEEKSLIIAETWPDEKCAWSRYIEILDHQSKNYTFPFFKIVQTMHFQKDEDFETLIVFLNIFKEFFKTAS